MITAAHCVKGDLAMPVDGYYSYDPNCRYYVTAGSLSRRDVNDYNTRCVAENMYKTYKSFQRNRRRSGCIFGENGANNHDIDAVF